VRITRAVDSFSVDIHLADEAATLALGAALAAHIAVGDCLALRGDLGAGKTTLARGLITALRKDKTDDTDVPSPTYTLVQIYDTPKCELWHGDMYRLERAEDCIELGLEDAFLDCICLIEWPDKLGTFLPETAISVTLSFGGAGRTARIEGGVNWIEDLDVT